MYTQLETFLKLIPGVLSMIIIMVIAILSLALSGVAVHMALSSTSNNAALIGEYLYECMPVVYDENPKRIAILRLDDVQAYSWTDISLKLMRDAIARDMSVVAGVIPKNIADDTRLIDFLEKHDCRIELALHGYDHGSGSDADTSTSEFGILNAAEALRKIDAGLAELSAFSEVRIMTFIPPQNQISDAARDALTTRGITILSSEGDKRYDYDTAAWNYSENRFVAAHETLAGCDVVWENDTLCVIMLHPQDYADGTGALDSERYRQYKKLLEGLEERRAAVMTFPEASKFLEVE